MRHLIHQMYQKNVEEIPVTKTIQDIAALATSSVQSYNTVSTNTPDVI